MPAQHHGGGVAAPPLRPLAVPDPAAGQFQTGAVEHLQQAAGPVPGGPVVLRPGDVRDPGVPEGDQVLGRQPGPAAVVGQQRQVVRVVGLAVDVDHRHPDLAGQRGPGVVGVAQHDEAVHPAGQQRADVVPATDRVAPGVTEQDRHLLAAEGVLDREQDRDREPVGQFVGDQTDRLGPAGAQAAGELVGLERQFLRRLQDPLPGLRGHLVAVVQRLGRGRHRDAGQPGHVAQSDRSGTLSAHRKPFGMCFAPKVYHGHRWRTKPLDGFISDCLHPRNRFRTKVAALSEDADEASPNRRTAAVDLCPRGTHEPYRANAGHRPDRRWRRSLWRRRLRNHLSARGRPARHPDPLDPGRHRSRDEGLRRGLQRQAPEPGRGHLVPERGVPGEDRVRGGRQGAARPVRLRRRLRPAVRLAGPLAGRHRPVRRSCRVQGQGGAGARPRRARGRASNYAVPHTIDMSVMLYNKDLFKKAGLDPEKPPVTLGEFADDGPHDRQARRRRATARTSAATAAAASSSPSGRRSGPAAAT